MTNLFQQKRFQMHSGGYSDFKLECDALTTGDYETLAFIISRNIKFGEVYGIPRGGLPFGDALKKYITPNHPTLLIADDVLTTGGSMEEAKGQFIAKGYDSANIRGIVVFARGELKSWIESIFTMSSQFWQND